MWLEVSPGQCLAFQSMNQSGYLAAPHPLVSNCASTSEKQPEGLPSSLAPGNAAVGRGCFLNGKACGWRFWGELGGEDLLGWFFGAR
jgi:hypothetical protein